MGKNINVVFWLLAGAASVGACGGSVKKAPDPSSHESCSDVCELAEDCTTPNYDSFDVSDCIRSCDDAEEAVEETGCEEAFDEFVDCSVQEFTCEEEAAPCKYESEEVYECLLDEQDEPSPVLPSSDDCSSSCEMAGNCDSYFSVADCQVSCGDVLQAVASAGCSTEYDRVLSCSIANYSCQGVGSACDAEIETFTTCVSGS